MLEFRCWFFFDFFLQIEQNRLNFKEKFYVTFGIFTNSPKLQGYQGTPLVFFKKLIFQMWKFEHFCELFWWNFEYITYFEDNQKKITILIRRIEEN